MKPMIKAAVPLLAVLLLSSCGGKKEPPQSYDLEGNSLPSLDALVELDEGVEFEESEGDGEEGAGVSYVYSKLSAPGEIAEEYTQQLEKDYGCVIASAPGSSTAPDFSTDSGQALAVQELEDSEQVFLLTLQWEEEACTVTPSMAGQDVLPQDERFVTLEEAVELVRRTPLSVLGLSGTSMDEYIILPQDGTVYLDGKPCILLNIYQEEDHQFEQSYLLDMTDMQLYGLDRETNEAIALH